MPRTTEQRVAKAMQKEAEVRDIMGQYNLDRYPQIADGGEGDVRIMVDNVWRGLSASDSYLYGAWMRACWRTTRRISSSLELAHKSLNEYKQCRHKHRAAQADDVVREVINRKQGLDSLKGDTGRLEVIDTHATNYIDHISMAAHNAEGLPIAYGGLREFVDSLPVSTRPATPEPGD